MGPSEVTITLLSKSTRCLEYPVVFTLAIFCPVTDIANCEVIRASLPMYKDEFNPIMAKNLSIYSVSNTSRSAGNHVRQLLFAAPE
jgi:hypothetical protein